MRIGVVLVIGAVLFLTILPVVRACWTPVSDPLPESWGVPLDLLVDPVHPHRWIVTTPIGAAVSDDGGHSFEFRPLPFLGRTLYSLRIDPDEPDRLWGTTGDRWGSSSFIRSDDRGRTWREVAPSPREGSWTVAAVHREGTCLLAQWLYDSGCSTSEGVYRSTDSGLTWSEMEPVIHGWSTRIQSVHGTEEIYLLPQGYEQDLYYSPDAGDSWVVIPAPGGSSLDNLDAFGVGGPDGRELLLLGTIREGTETEDRLYRSIDGGDHWTEITGQLRSYWEEITGDTLVVTPASELFLCPDAGYSWPPLRAVPVAHSPDGGATWQPAGGGLPPDAWLPRSVRGAHRLVQPPWSPTGPYALVAEPDGPIRLYRYEPEVPIPRIALAGWIPDRISASAGGDLKLQAYVPPIHGHTLEVELLHQGIPTGVFMTPIGDGLHRLSFPVGPGTLTAGYLAVGLVARDQDGREGHPWPGLGIGQAPWSAPPLPPPWTGSPPSGLGGLRPSILSAGWAFSGGSCPAYPAADLVAFVHDPDGAWDVNLVEVMWQGLPTSLVLEPTEGGPRDFRGAFSSLDGCHGVTLAFWGVPEGTIWLELQGRDTVGNRTGLWPYLTVDP